MDVCCDSGWQQYEKNGYVMVRPCPIHKAFEHQVWKQGGLTQSYLLGRPTKRDTQTAEDVKRAFE